jgi:hypothetical protein
MSTIQVSTKGSPGSSVEEWYFPDANPSSRLFRGTCCIVMGHSIVPINPMVMKRVRFYYMVMVLRQDQVLLSSSSTSASSE